MIRRLNIAAFLLVCDVTGAFGAELMVPEDFASIQAAIDAAQPGDVVRVQAGTYAEPVRLKSGVTLEGEGRDSTIIQCHASDASTLTADGVMDAVVRGLTLEQHAPMPNASAIAFPFPVVTLTGSAVEFSACAVRNGVGNGVFVMGGTAAIGDSLVHDNAENGLLSEAGTEEVALRACVVERNGGSGLVLHGERTVLQRNQLRDNRAFGFDASDGAAITGKGNDYTDNRWINQREIQRLLLLDEFAFLETIATRLRNERARSQSGDWQLDFYYEWLTDNARRMGPDEEQALTAKATAWQEAYPDSITCRVFLAKAYHERAWGHWEANNPEAYSAYVEKAWSAFDDSRDLETKDPQYYAELASLNLESPKELNTGPTTLLGHVIRWFMPRSGSDQARRHFLRGVELEPLYFPLYTQQARALLYKTGVTADDVVRFAEESADDTQSLAGDTLYAVIATYVARHYGPEDFMAYFDFSWPRIQRGYEALLAEYPDSTYRHNTYAYVACVYRDEKKAQELFQKVGGNWNRAVWSTEARYNNFRAWAFEGESYSEKPLLQAAIQAGDRRAIARLLESGSDPNVTNENGASMLRLAVEYGDPWLIQRLLDAGADPNQVSDGGWSPLRLAARIPNLDLVQTLLEHGGDPNQYSGSGWTPLLDAIFVGHAENALALLDGGGDPNQTYGPGKDSALGIAVQKGVEPVIRALLERGADPNVAAPSNEPPIVDAAENQDIELVRLLLEHGADPNLGNGDGWNALFTAADKGNLELAMLLVEHGADVNAKEYDGWSVFHMATMTGATPVVKYLLEKNPDGAFFIPDSGRTLLHQAAKSGHLDLVELLVERGLDVNAVETESGKTPLEFAVDGGHEAVAKFLREHGAA